MASRVVNHFVHGINYGLRRQFKDAVIAVVDNNLFSSKAGRVAIAFLESRLADIGPPVFACLDLAKVELYLRSTRSAGGLPSRERHELRHSFQECKSLWRAHSQITLVVAPAVGQEP